MKIHIELDAFDIEGIQRTISALQKLVGQTPESEQPDENPEPTAEKAPEKKTPAKRRSRKSTPKKQAEKPEEAAAEEAAPLSEDVTEAIKAIMPRLIKAGKRKDLTSKVQKIGCKLSDMNDKQKAEMLAFMHTLDA